MARKSRSGSVEDIPEAEVVSEDPPNRLTEPGTLPETIDAGDTDDSRTSENVAAAEAATPDAPYADPSHMNPDNAMREGSNTAESQADPAPGEPDEARDGLPSDEPPPAQPDPREPQAAGPSADIAAAARPEPRPDPRPEPRAAAVPSAPPAALAGRGGFAGGLFGGILVAVAAGAAIVSFRPDLLQPVVQPDLEAALLPLTSQIAEESQRSAAIAEDLASLRAGLPDPAAAASEAVAAATAALEAQQAALSDRLDAAVADLGGRIDGVADGLAPLTERIASLDARLTEVEKRPLAESSVVDPTVVAAYEREIDALRLALESQGAEARATADDLRRVAEEARARIEQVGAEAAAMQAEAQAAAQAAAETADRTARLTTARTSLVQIQSALENGGSFDEPLARLQDASDAEVPAALSAIAVTGVPTQADLLAAFPEAARAALSASIRSGLDGSDDMVGRVTAFLQVQTGARSLEPREGDDPDAVLSRAEAALREGRITDALALLDQLPEPGRAAMEPWRAGAEARAAALAAADALAQTLTAN